MHEGQASKRVLPVTNLREFFKDALHGALEKRHLAVEDQTEHYVVNLLTLFADADALFERDAHDAEPRVVENAAESALEHHLGMTCDPVAGFVQVPCIERCAFGAVKACTAYAIASNEIASRHRVDLDATITALAQTAKEMNSKYKETSEAGLAVSVTLC